MVVNNFLFPHQSRLPIKFHIWFLPFDGFSWKWAVNYLLQLSSSIASEYYVFYYPMTMILMDQSCWKVDMALLKLEELGSFLQTFDKMQTTGKSLDSLLEKIVDMTADVVTWQEKARKLLQISFLGEFTLMSVFFCSCLHALAGNFQETAATIGLMSGCFTQIYFYCWLGTRVENRFVKLTNCIYDLEWSQMEPTQQRKVQMILLAAQNMKGFHGIVKKVNLSSFQKVRAIVCKIY